MTYDHPTFGIFCLLGHIDHGKSTLADRLLELTGTLTAREMTEQVLDTMDLEREKGVTIKASAVQMRYKARDGQEYELNMLDGPGHVDFQYEISRVLAAAEGAVLVVDATQGVEAQTLSHIYLALEADLEIIPVLNKIDLISAQPDLVAGEIEHILGTPAAEMLRVSAKTGQGVDELLEAIVAARAAAQRRSRMRRCARSSLTATMIRSRASSPTCASSKGGLTRAASCACLPPAWTSEPIEIGKFAPKMQPMRLARRGRSGLRGDRPQDRARLSRGRHVHDARASRQRRRCPAIARPSRWCSRRSIRWTPTTITSSKTRWKNSNSTTPRCNISPRLRRRSAMASAAASWACSTWRSSRSGWSANTTWTFLPPRPASSTKW